VGLPAEERGTHDIGPGSPVRWTDMKITLAIVALALLAACDDPITVKDVAGTYSLTAMDAHPLPQLLTATLSCDQWVHGGDLTLQATGAFRLVVRGEMDCTRAGGPVQVMGWDFPGTFSVAGTALQFVSPLPPSTGGELRFSGRIDGLRGRVIVSGLELQLQRAVDLEFRR